MPGTLQKAYQTEEKLGTRYDRRNSRRSFHHSYSNREDQMIIVEQPLSQEQRALDAALHEWAIKLRYRHNLDYAEYSSLRSRHVCLLYLLNYPK